MDISLDPWPYAGTLRVVFVDLAIGCLGTTTTCESFLMGVPCLTLAGKCHAQNVGASLIRAVGLDASWIATSTQDYINTAIKKASNFEALAKIRKGLRTQMLNSDLCNSKAHIENLEAEYRRMWNSYITAKDQDDQAENSIE